MDMISDAHVQHLVASGKTIVKRRSGKYRDTAIKHANYDLLDDDENKYILYSRQNIRHGMENDFSCGLAYLSRDNVKLTLVRYNGGNHDHCNKVEKVKIGEKPHIHRYRKEYMEKTGRADGFAEVTDRFYTLDGALQCLVQDCNIFETKGPQLTLETNDS